MNLSELTKKVQNAVQDTSVASLEATTDWLNNALNDAAGRVDMGFFRDSATVLTVLGQAFTTIPATYSHNLFFAANVTQKVQITVKNALTEILRAHPLLDKVGAVEVVVIEGGKLWYHGIPTTVETLTLRFYRKPAALILTRDVPEGIPAHLHEMVLVSYAAAQGWELIEQGMNEQKKNTLAYLQKYEMGLKKLRHVLTSRGGNFYA